MSSLKKRLGKGDLVVGIMISELRNPNFVHLLAQSGYDFFIIDNEHGAYSRRRFPILSPRPGGRESSPS